MNQQKGVESSSSCDLTYPCKSILHIIKQFLVIMQLRNTWKVLVFSFASMTVAMQWTASEICLPPFLERRFGESVPIYTIQSIHMLGCLILPPFAQAFTSSLEDFRVILPGLWVMAASPIFVALSPTVFWACVWQIAMTAGQVLWSPRQDSWTASLPPTGMEGLFFAVGSSRALLAPLADVVMGAMNENYNTNCLDAMTGMDISARIRLKALMKKVKAFCNVCQSKTAATYFLTRESRHARRPVLNALVGKVPNPSTFWFLLVTVSMTCPIITWFFLPFLRGHHRNDKFYGILSVSLNRVLGICGIQDEQSQFFRHEHIVEDDDHAYESECRSASIEQRLNADKVEVRQCGRET